MSKVPPDHAFIHSTSIAELFRLRHLLVSQQSKVLLKLKQPKKLPGLCPTLSSLTYKIEENRIKSLVHIDMGMFTIYGTKEAKNQRTGGHPPFSVFSVNASESSLLVMRSQCYTWVLQLWHLTHLHGVRIRSPFVPDRSIT